MMQLVCCSGATVSPLAMIPLEDIANIQVLKDAAATSLYGSKGAYGVILIETKRGETAKPKVSYSANFVVKTPPRLRDVLAGGARERSELCKFWEMIHPPIMDIMKSINCRHCQIA